MTPLHLDAGKIGCGLFRNDRIRRPEIGEIAGLRQSANRPPRRSTRENPHLTLRAKKLDIAFETRMAAAIGLAEFRRRNLFEDGA